MICQNEYCNKEAFINEDYCTLHCEKTDYQSDKSKNLFLETFFKELVEYVIQDIFQSESSVNIPSKDNIRLVLENRNKDRTIRENVLKYLKNQVVNLDHILFPARDDRDLFDYQKPLEYLKGINFSFCEFNAWSLRLQNTEVFFDECVFNGPWLLYNHKTLENVRNVLYQECTFMENVSTLVEDYDDTELDNPIFSNCNFKSNLLLNGVTLKSFLFLDTEEKKLSLNCIEMIYCTFKEKVFINKYSINKFESLGCEFERKLEFKQNTVENFKIDNTNFRDIFDCYSTTFQKFFIKKSIFEGFVGFEECEFGNEAFKKDRNYLAEFKYATFLSFVNFRNSIFYSGLDLTNINLKEPPNFLNVEITPFLSPRETYRIIKYSFDKSCNYIEANRFYIKEMLKFKEESKNNKDYGIYNLLRLYQLTSNFGQSFLRPIGFIFLSSVFYWLLIIGYEHNILYRMYPYLTEELSLVAIFFNGVSKHIIPFAKILKEGMESISLLFYILFTSFLWLIILAIKRHTKR